jgi:hypothetical protein
MVSHCVCGGERQLRLTYRSECVKDEGEIADGDNGGEALLIDIPRLLIHALTDVVVCQ